MNDSARSRPGPVLVWMRNDLRLADQEALRVAAGRGGAVVPVFVWAPEEEGPWAPGGASRWWLEKSLRSLGQDLRAAGSRLILRRGPVVETLLDLARDTGARAVFWSRRYEPAVVARDARVDRELRAAGLETASFNSALLHEPDTVRNKAGKPYQVFTPYWRECLSRPGPPAPVEAPRRLAAPPRWPASLALEDLTLAAGMKWEEGLNEAWTPGEAGALRQLDRFLEDGLAGYDRGRDMPGEPGTSRLSPHLQFGEISPRRVWAAVCAAGGRGGRYAAELGWREFAHQLLWHFPHTPEAPLRAEFARFPWIDDPAWLRAWQRGLTGYPVVDAGMRQLWQTGWMHNRVRMVAASFLVKDLRISWVEGARWFWDTLVDAGLAPNTLGWQWTAGCGADAAPFFRVFNPAGQGEKFDPAGVYVRRWAPELAGLPDAWIHQPHKAPPETLRKAGVELGRTYPRPIVSHVIAREAALEAYARLKE